MKGKVRITPRARRAAEKAGLDVSAMTYEGTGFAGGICERDILAMMQSGAGEAGHVEADPALRSTPLARRIADAHGIDAGSLNGSGSHGKVTGADVLAAVRTHPTGGVSGVAHPDGMSGAVSDDGKTIAHTAPYAGVRKIIGERLAMSKFTAPHLYFTQRVDLSALNPVRETINARQEKKTSVTDYIARACVLALQKYPGMNSSLVGDVIETYENVNLGIAVASPSGLIVPVVKNAQEMSVIEISKAASALFAKAREGKLMPSEYSGGTFTISNLGMFGIENFTAIINPPESGILAVSSAKDEAVVVTGGSGGKSIEIRPMMNITLTVDHRLIDGLLAAQFVTEVKRLLENPVELFIDL
jgi:pyruvate dehydrogenase E2 component (dihydrolipoamide acetyltransferase)